MDGRRLGTIGAIAGTVLGVIGAVMGTFRSIKSSQGPKERRLLLRLAVLMPAGICTFMGLLALVPFETRVVLWTIYVPGLIWLVMRANACLAHIRAEDRADAGFAAMDDRS